MSKVKGPGRATWLCNCECGDKKKIKEQALIRGNNKSCGCERHKGFKKDISGQKFGKLTAIRLSDKQDTKRTKWLCRCECGKEKNVMIDHLGNGHTISCGCWKLDNIISQRFGRLIVFARSKNKKDGSARWFCRCDCGNITEVDASSLKNGHTQSCGCYNKERTKETQMINLVGKRFGKLVVIKENGTNSGSIQWLCQCDCGNFNTVDGGCLREGGTRSCSKGCLNKKDGDTRAFGELWKRYVNRAKDANLSFFLTETQFREITSSSCFYCGRPADNPIKNRPIDDQYFHSGIDRMDNKQGYVYENCVPCCAKCNKMKMILSKEDFISHAIKIAKNIEQKENGYEKKFDLFNFTSFPTPGYVWRNVAEPESQTSDF